MSAERSRTTMRSHRLPDPLYQLMKELAEQRHITATDALVEAIALWIARETR